MIYPHYTKSLKVLMITKYYKMYYMYNQAHSFTTQNNRKSSYEYSC